MVDDIEARLREVELEIGSRRAEHQIDPTLDRVAELVSLLGDPHRAFPVVHVTGTNGKTSTTRMTESLLRERGLRADEMIREVAAIAGGKGGGKPHMAQAGIPEGGNIAEALSAAADVVRRRLSAGA